MIGLFHGGNNIFFIGVGLIDFSRRYFSLKAMTVMLTTNKKCFDSKFGIIPTINWLDPLSWSNWLKMRNVSMDFGYKYYLRIMIYNSTFLAFYATIMVV